MTRSFLDHRLSHPMRPIPFDGLPQLRAYWDALRPTGGLPERSMIDPRGLAGLLDRVFLAERIGHGLARIRIAGSGLAELAGQDLQGLPLSCLFAAESRPLLAQSVERVFAEPALAELDLGSDRRSVGQATARLLLLPLAEGRDDRMLIGAFGFASGGQVPCKWQILARREERAVPPAPPRAAGPSLHLVMASEGTGRPLRRKGHLTLVHFSE